MNPHPQNPLSTLPRRQFLKTTATGLASLGLAPHLASAAADPKPKRQFTLCLACGMIGVPGDARQVLKWAGQFGFESVEPATSFLAKLSDEELQAYRDEMKAGHLAWGAAGLPVEFRGSDAEFETGMKSLPGFATSLQRAGVNRVATWLSPSHRSLTYMANFRRHATRLRECARVLGDHDIRLGLEYVGPKTAWSSNRFPFIHTLAEMKDLIAEIGRDNVGFLLDSWHWYTAEETEADLLTLQARDVVMCHLNDAPKDIPLSQQIDSRRELPCATGVIDVKAYLGALIKIGYDGPVACEPFNEALRKLPPEQALSTVAAAMKKAVALAEGA
jgi:sugar phosphate isomerase/epimerase